MGICFIGCDYSGNFRESIDTTKFLVRRQLHDPAIDPLQFCNCVCYWGKCSVEKGTTLANLVGEFQSVTKEGPTFLGGIGTSKCPGGIFMVPTKEDFVIWGYFAPSHTPSLIREDLTRRGGIILDEKAKQKLQETLAVCENPLLNALMEGTPAEDITEAGLFDRQNLSLSFSSAGKRIVLLGDAAHPQTPFLGQGANMAIVDAFVWGSAFAHGSVETAASLIDSKHRRKAARSIVKEARLMCKWSVSSHPFTCWMNQAIVKWLPLRMLLGQVNRYDASNRKILRHYIRNGQSYFRFLDLQYV